mgnify:CR=1 FL=1
MKLTSPAFSEGKTIPKAFTRDGADRSPALHIEDVPRGAKSLVLILDDPDAPNGTFTHWVLFNISPETRDIHEDVPPVMATQGRNDYGEIGYGGPQPPSGEHRYVFKLYALDTVLSLSRGATKSDVQAAMKGRILAETKLTGRYASAEAVGAR